MSKVVIANWLQLAIFSHFYFKAKFGVDTFPVAGNNSGNFDIYLSIYNNLNVTGNLITTSEDDLLVCNNVSASEN